MSLNLTPAKIKKLITKPVLVDFNKLTKVKQRQLLEVISYALHLRLTPYTWFTECNYYVGSDIGREDWEATLEDVGNFNTNLGGSNLLVNLVMSDIIKDILSKSVSSIKDNKVNTKRGVNLSNTYIAVDFRQNTDGVGLTHLQSTINVDLSDLNFTPFLKYLEVSLEQENAK